MPEYSEEFREHLRELRDAYLADFEDKTDPRYLALTAQFAAADAREGLAPTQQNQSLANTGN
jgi:hypothetical protein